MSVKVAGNFLINALKSGQKTINVKELPKSLKKYTKEVAGQRDALAKAVKNKPRRRAGSLNNTVTEFITEFSICCISLVSREITSPFFSLVKKLTLNF